MKKLIVTILLFSSCVQAQDMNQAFKQLQQYMMNDAIQRGDIEAIRRNRAYEQTYDSLGQYNNPNVGVKKEPKTHCRTTVSMDPVWNRPIYNTTCD